MQAVATNAPVLEASRLAPKSSSTNSRLIFPSGASCAALKPTQSVVVYETIKPPRSFVTYLSINKSLKLKTATASSHVTLNYYTVRFVAATAQLMTEVQFWNLWKRGRPMGEYHARWRSGRPIGARCVDGKHKWPILIGRWLAGGFEKCGNW